MSNAIAENPRAVFSPRNITAFPAMFWDQKTGNYKVFKSAAEVPAGWKPYHPNSAAEREGAAEEQPDTVAEDVTQRTPRRPARLNPTTAPTAE